MKRVAAILLLTLLASRTMPQPTETAEISRDYRTAIAQAEVRQGTDRRAELERCIKLWGVVHVQIEPLNKSSNEHSVLLEIGNSGFPRYDYVRIDGFLLKSSFGAETDVSQSVLSERLKKIYSGRQVDLRGSADAEVDDGDCYFLTVSGGGTHKSIAVYELPATTSSGLLIKEILKEAQKGKVP
jgi:hypothetical protein